MDEASGRFVALALDGLRAEGQSPRPPQSVHAACSTQSVAGQDTNPESDLEMTLELGVYSCGNTRARATATAQPRGRSEFGPALAEPMRALTERRRSYLRPAVCLVMGGGGFLALLGCARSPAGTATITARGSLHIFAEEGRIFVQGRHGRWMCFCRSALRRAAAGSSPSFPQGSNTRASGQVLD